MKNFRYPEAARKKKIQGQVILTLVVEKDGSLSNIKVAKSVSDDLDAEAIRIVSKSPKWIPGRINNFPVATNYTLPMNFALAEE